MQGDPNQSRCDRFGGRMQLMKLVFAKGRERLIEHNVSMSHNGKTVERDCLAVDPSKHRLQLLWIHPLRFGRCRSPSLCGPVIQLGWCGCQNTDRWIRWTRHKAVYCRQENRFDKSVYFRLLCNQQCKMRISI